MIRVGDVAWLWITGWHGTTADAVKLVGETPKRFRVTPNGETKVRLGGRQRWLHPGKTALVPKYAVRPEPPRGQ